jgi:hypothetical protein
MNWNQEFRDLVGLPELSVSSLDSRDLQNSLALKFPSDYQEWARQYESIEICNELIVWNWFSARRPRITTESASAMLRGMELAEGAFSNRSDVFDAQGLRSPDPKPWIPLTPGPGGIFPWGTDSNGTLYLWDARSANSESWTVVIYNRTWRDFECGFVEFLVRLLRGEYQNTAMLTREWPWIPAIRELEREVDGVLSWHTPTRWTAYYEAYSEKEDDFDYEWEDFSWVERFRA